MSNSNKDGQKVNGQNEAAGKNGEERVENQPQDTTTEAKEEVKELSQEEMMAKKLEECEGKLAEASDKYLRLAAEFDTYRRRTAKERLDIIANAGEEVIKGLLPILDDCERALQVLRQSTDSTAAVEGTELIYSKLMGYLKSKGLSVIEAKEKEFDTEFHEAVAQFPVEDKSKKNIVIDVVQQGYMLNGKVIRYAKVVVGM